MLFKSLITASLVFVSVYAQSQIDWTTINTPSTGTLWEIQFVDGQTGFVYSSNGEVLKSIDEGQSWQVMASGIGSIHGLSFTDENHGWVCGWSGLLKKTSDGGETWTDVVFPEIGTETPTDFDAIFFKDSLNGYVAAYDFDASTYTQIYWTDDAGDSWTPTPIFAGAAIVQNIDFLDMDKGWAVTSGTIYSTDDGASSWDSHLTGT